MPRKNTMKLEKIKKFFQSKYFILFIITALALFVRLLNLDKESGLWFDEMLTYSFSSKSFPWGILKTLHRYDFHMPLYYLSINIWMKLFGSADLTLRLYSVLWGVLTIPALFFLGKTYKSEKLGYFLAVVGSLSPILIYYSQEFRFYSMDIFFATISLTYFLKLLDNPTKKNFVLFGFANLIILYIETTGILFVGLEFLLLFINFYKTDFLKSFFKYSLGFFILMMPYLLLLSSYTSAANNSLMNPLCFSVTTYRTFIYLFNDLFSPVITCLYGSKDYIYQSFFSSPAFILGFCFMSLPSLCFLIGFISEFKKLNRRLVYLMAFTFGFLFVKILLTFTGAMVLVTRYILICFPALLLMSCDGLLRMKNKILKKLLVSIILIIFIYNTCVYKNMPAFSERSEGLNYLSEGLADLNLGKNDYLLYPMGSFLMQKYIKNVNYVDFGYTSLTYLDKTKQEACKIFDKDFVFTTTKKNAAEKFKPFFDSQKPTKTMEKFANEQIRLIPKGGRLIYIQDVNINVYNNKQLSTFTLNNKKSKAEYYHSLFYLVFNKIDNDFESLFNENKSLKLVKTFWVSNKGIRARDIWQVSVYEKIR